MADAPPMAFDGAAAWATLTPELQARVGAIALELAVAGRTAEGIRDHAIERACDAATIVLLDYLESALEEALGPARPLVPAMLGDWCRVCGCSQFDPCEQGCDWASPGLCTVCAAGTGRRCNA
jgi:hypothetical protein